MNEEINWDDFVTFDEGDIVDEDDLYTGFETPDYEIG